MQPGDIFDGKYRLVKQLRAGGMGAVYAASRVALGDMVAIKVILPSHDSAVNRARFLREAQAAARIHHPNVVRIFDFGTDPEGMPYIVMEHLTGTPLDDEVRSRGPLPLPRAMRIFRQICSAIDAGHRRGVLHRDLKPGNVMLAVLDDREETVKVLDFGLARFTNAGDAMSLTTPGAMLGTYPYMPPELILGGEATGRSDIYALGVILYELVTGRVPFSGPSLMALMQKITAGVYLPPDELVPGVPDSVVSAIAAALATEPEHRPPSATELANRAGFGVRDEADDTRREELPETRPTVAMSPDTGRIETHASTIFASLSPALAPEPAIAPVSARSYRLASDWPELSRFVGRERELETLAGEYDAAVSGEGRLVVVVGDAGVGKSSLAKAFGSLASSRDAIVLGGRFYDYEGSRPAPYETFLHMIRAGREARSSPVTRDSQGRVDRLFEALAAGRGPGDPGLGDEAEKWREWSAIGDEFARLSTDRSLVLVFDDLQWAGRHNLELLAFLQRSLADKPVFIVGTARDGDAQSSTGGDLGRWLIAQGNRRACAVLPLRPFTEDEVRAWLQTTFGRFRVRPLDLQRLVGATDGNPYYLFEVVRRLMTEGAIAKRGEEWECAPLDRVELPETVSNAVRGKLEGLGEDMRSVLETAAVIGDEFRFETLRLATGLDEEALEDVLERASRQQFLVESGGTAPDDFRFYNSTIRRVLYEDMPSRRRRRLHGRVVEALERVHAGRLEWFAATLCYHHHAVGAWAHALRWGLVAAEDALARHDTASADANVARARDATSRLVEEGNPPAPAELARLDLVAGTVNSRLGKAESAGSLLAAAATAAEDAGDAPLLAQALIELAQHQLGLGGHDDAFATAQRAAAVAASAGDRPRHLAARAVGGLVLTRLGRFDEATERFESLLSELRATDPPTLRAHTLRNLAWCVLKRGSFKRAETLAQQALEIARATHDLVAQQVVLSALGAVYGENGDYESALPYMAESLKLSRTLAWRRREGIELANTGEMLWMLGRHAQAEEHLNEALSIFVEIGDRACEGDCRVNLGRVLLSAGRPVEAVVMLERGREICEATGRREYAAFALLHIGEARLSQGALDVAARAFEKARYILSSLDYYALWQAQVGLARVAARSGDRSAARRHLDDAAEFLRRRGLAGGEEIEALRTELDI